jgi:activator of Hsp90 ATPase-like protein
VSFERVDRGTRLTVVQKSFASVEQRDLHGQGWNSTFNKLERLFA